MFDGVPIHGAPPVWPIGTQQNRGRCATSVLGTCPWLSDRPGCGTGGHSRQRPPPMSPRHMDQCHRRGGRRPVRVVGSPIRHRPSGTAPGRLRHRPSTAIRALRSKKPVRPAAHPCAVIQANTPASLPHSSEFHSPVRPPTASTHCGTRQSCEHPCFMMRATIHSPRLPRPPRLASPARTRARTGRALPYSPERSHPAPGCDSPTAPSGS
jgi:hypothetical protein